MTAKPLTIPEWTGTTGSERVRQLIAANPDACRNDEVTISKLTLTVQASGVSCSKATTSKWFYAFKKADSAADHGANAVPEAPKPTASPANTPADAAASVLIGNCGSCGDMFTRRQPEDTKCRRCEESFPESPPTAKPASTNAANADAAAVEAGAAVAAALAAVAKGAGVDIEEVTKVVRRELEGETGAQVVRDAIAAERLRPRIKRVTLEVIGEDKRTAVEIGEQAHPMLAEALRLIYAGIKNLWFCGPAGSGKTTLAKQIADHLKRPFGTINCTAGMSETHLTGRLVPRFTGDEVGIFIPTPFVDIYEGGGIFLCDEFDAADPNVVLALNTATSNGYLPLPNRIGNHLAQRHDDTVLIIATNTWGAGPDDQYSGRDVIDAAVRDRYAMSKLFIGYSHELECELFGDFAREAKGDGFESWNAPAYLSGLDWRGVFERIRFNIGKHEQRRTLSTRAKVHAMQLSEAGYSTRELVTLYMQDWTPQERAKGLEGVDGS